MKNPFKPIGAEIIDIITETPSIKTFVFKPDEPIEFKTGEFVELTLPGVGEAPFTPSSNPAISKQMDITIMKAGCMTEKLHAVEKGTRVGIRGPLGEGYPLDEMLGKNILIVGGGVGLAPLRSFIFALKNRRKEFGKIIICFGARTPDDMCYREAIPKWEKDFDMEIRLTVDKASNGWKYKEGLVTDIYSEKDVENGDWIAASCGPPIMMKFATKKLIEIGFKPEEIYLSMERNMSCGIGQCRHCMIDHLYICKDGPVFKYSEIDDLKTDIFT